jgi:hypothetical protein
MLRSVLTSVLTAFDNFSEDVTKALLISNNKVVASRVGLFVIVLAKQCGHRYNIEGVSCVCIYRLLCTSKLLA